MTFFLAVYLHDVATRTGWGFRSSGPFANPVFLTDGIINHRYDSTSNGPTDNVIAPSFIIPNQDHEWIEFNFWEPKLVAEVVITLNRGQQLSSQMRDFHVRVSDSTVAAIDGSSLLKTDAPLCKNVTGPGQIHDIIITCEEPLWGQYLFIQMYEREFGGKPLNMNMEEIYVVFKEIQDTECKEKLITLQNSSLILNAFQR